MSLLDRKPRRWIGAAMNGITAVLLLGIVLGVAYLIWGDTELTTTTTVAAASSLAPGAPAPIQLSAGYTLPIRYGQLGPALVRAGVIDLPHFLQVSKRNGASLSPALAAIVTAGSDAPVVIDADNAHFLLNFFWAVGLANRNPVILEGALQQDGEGRVDQFASTGGWILASKPITAILGSLPLIVLDGAQQKRLEAVAGAVYRPCCGNNTLFPDCNHGMAMMGILELMAAQNASEDQMFEAAKYVNTFWFPQQMAEVAAYFKQHQKLEFDAVDARQVVSREIFSAAGFQSIHQWLKDRGVLGQPSEGGSTCGT